MCIKTRRILHYADFKIVGTVAYKCLGKKCFGGKLLQFYISFVFVNKFSSRPCVATLPPVCQQHEFSICYYTDRIFNEKFVFKTWKGLRLTRGTSELFYPFRLQREFSIGTGALLDINLMWFGYQGAVIFTFFHILRYNHPSLTP